MSLAARKSDVKNHLSRHVTRHVISPDLTSLSVATSDTEEPKTATKPNSDMPGVDHGERSASAGVYAQNSIIAQDR